MNGKSEMVGGVIGTCLSAIGTSLQIDEVLQIVSLIITILGGLISLVVIPLLNWYRNAKKDGKIDEEEMAEAAKIAKEGIENISKKKGGKK